MTNAERWKELAENNTAAIDAHKEARERSAELRKRAERTDAAYLARHRDGQVSYLETNARRAYQALEGIDMGDDGSSGIGFGE